MGWAKRVARACPSFPAPAPNPDEVARTEKHLVATHARAAKARAKWGEGHGHSVVSDRRRGKEGLACDAMQLTCMEYGGGEAQSTSSASEPVVL